jgi:hypothetical protein
MRKLFGYLALWFFVVSVIYSIYAIFAKQNLLLLSLPIAVFLGVYLFKGTLNLVLGLGFIYWVLRDTHKGFSMSLGIMRETNYPWRTGNGIQIGIGKYVFQIGFCKRNNAIDEMNGLLNALKGRELHHKPKEIREWR